jgi:iron complex outermembrane receptor protein
MAASRLNDWLSQFRSWHEKSESGTVGVDRLPARMQARLEGSRPRLCFDAAWPTAGLQGWHKRLRAAAVAASNNRLPERSPMHALCEARCRLSRLRKKLLISGLLPLFWFATGGLSEVFAQTLPDGEAAQAPSPDAASPPAPSGDESQAEEPTPPSGEQLAKKPLPSSEEPPAEAPPPTSDVSEEMPMDVMIQPSDDLLVSKQPTFKGQEDLSLEALLNIDISVASKSLMKQSEAPSIVTVITRSMIEALGVRSVAEALRDVPGFYIVDDGVTSNIAVRGINAGPNSWSRIVKVMVDGHPVTDYSTGGTFLGPELIPIEAVESIEVIRGAGSALYGANAFLGVINIVTKKPKEKGTYAETGAEAGAIRTNLGGSGHVLGSVAVGDKRLSYIMVSARHDQFDRSGLQVPNGSPNQQAYAGQSSHGDLTRPTSFVGKGVFDLGRLGNLATQYHFQRIDAMAEFSDLSILSHDNRIVRSNNIAGADHNLSFLNDALLLHTFGTYTVTQDLPDQTLDTGDPLYTYRRERMDRTYQVGSELSYHYKDHSALLGADYMSTSDTGDTAYQVVRQTGNAQNGGNQILFAPGHSLQYGNTGVFAQVIVRPQKKVGITGGMRYDWNDRFGNSFNPRLAVVLQPLPSLYVKGLYGTSFVPPTPVQLYAVPLRFDGGVLGNSRLKNQRAKTAELQFGYRAKETLDVALNGFYTVIDDRIEFEQLGNQMEAMNLTRSRSWGVELASYLNRRPVFARFAGSYESTRSDVPTLPPLWWNRLYATNGPGGNQSLGFPQLMGSATLGITLPQYHFQTALSARVTSSRKTSAANSYVAGKAYLLDSYTLLDFNVSSLDLRLIGKRLTKCSLHVNNVLNRKYAEPGFLGVDVPSAGVGVFLNITQELGTP